jgi:transposase InsO family protein
MDQYTRRIIGFTIHVGIVDGPALCRMSNRAVHDHPTPRFISSDHDPLYRYHRWRANLRIREITEVKTIPYVPLSHPFVERLIGTIRREFLDRTLFWNERDLQHKLADFADYYNRHRVHSSLDGSIPAIRAGMENSNLIDIRDYRWQSHCRGLFQTPMAA